MISHHLSATEYNNLWDQCSSPSRQSPSYDIITHYLINHFCAVSFNANPRLKTSFGLVKFDNEKDYNWFLLNV